MAYVKYSLPTTKYAGAWVGDELDREHVLVDGGLIDPAAFGAYNAVSVVVGAAGASLAATSVPVAALSGPIPSGTSLSFGTNKFARLTAAAAAGATSLTVAAIPIALVSGDTATYEPPSGATLSDPYGTTNRKFVQSGTLIGRTYTERDAGTAYGPYTGGDDEVYLIVYDVFDANEDASVTLYRHTSLVHERYLPAATITNISTVRSNYQTIRGVA